VCHFLLCAANRLALAAELTATPSFGAGREGSSARVRIGFLMMGATGGPSRGRLSRRISLLLRSAASVFFAPFRANPRLLLWAKDEGLLCPTEHIHRTLRWLARRPLAGKPCAVVDVGAAGGGVVALLASSMPFARIYCFEPNRRAFPALESTFSGSSVEVRWLALASKEGQATFYESQNALSSSLLPLDEAALAEHPPRFREGVTQSRSSTVRVSTLDREMASVPLPIALLKLDVQGSELDVLAGGRTTLQRTDGVLTELATHRFYKGGCQYHQIDDYLRSAGFRLADIIVTYRGNSGVEEYDALYLREPPLE
jgi:FkbM family methyltransferase